MLPVPQMTQIKQRFKVGTNRLKIDEFDRHVFRLDTRLSIRRTVLCPPRDDGFAIAKIYQPEIDFVSLPRLPIYARWHWGRHWSCIDFAQRA